MTFWIVRSSDQPVDPTGAAALLAAPTTSVSQDVRPVTTTPSSEPPVTTTPPPVTTTTPETTTPPPPPPPPPCPTTLDGVKPHVAQVGNHIAGKFGIKDIGGAAGRAGGGEHPLGLALDFMVNTDTATGNAVADYVLANRKAFGVTYVIWRQRYNDGSGFTPMEDRGSPTANHMDHVHVSFQASATVNVTC
ncbi:hypothetical protein [Lentzea sp. NPDC092896]|uniref:hypothetical protein n=1 Tax=Lentzea sp. NPDC092896 TaxID=3364127 RepID=UPI003827A292